jgi:prepilin-type N-terminal cleavage/methylation domain-containing protein
MRFIDRLRGERGMTLIELMMAALICAVGIMATIAVLDTSREVSVKAEHREAMSHQAEREIERIMELPWAEFAHTVAPASSPTPGHPASYVNGNSYAYDRNTPSASETFAIETTGLVPAAGTAWTDGQTRLGGDVFRFVTQVNANVRRITVVVTGNGAKAPAPVLVSSIKTKPNMS